MSGALAYASAAIAIAWGAAHLVPTRAVVSGFGELAAGNRLILTMEWVAEAATLIFIGVLVAVAESVGGSAAGGLSAAIRLLAAAMLTAMAVLTALTGARAGVVFFRICPLVKGIAALLLVASVLAWPIATGSVRLAAARTWPAQPSASHFSMKMSSSRS